MEILQTDVNWVRPESDVDTLKGTWSFHQVTSMRKKYSLKTKTIILLLFRSESGQEELCINKSVVGSLDVKPLKPR